ncbi:hypothetical protein PCASD_17062 [Puccinia coronata f. sp. avenae]|uniref:Uncharacterized protein n=1 Tax=Puccinia coronata f. sp. avenae TaxID=200324 RepID=A0A2N5SME8_9BASI|nr:hypothetical protein PCASD_17062 [Puccinia coronata f. sp. avenae]
MESNRLHDMSTTASAVCSGLQGLLDTLESDDPKELNSDNMFSEADYIRTWLKEALFHVFLYFAPLIPETQGLPDQNHIKSWFIVWFTQFNLAIQNFIRAADTLSGC